MGQTDSLLPTCPINICVKYANLTSHNGIVISKMFMGSRARLIDLIHLSSQYFINHTREHKLAVFMLAGAAIAKTAVDKMVEEEPEQTVLGWPQ